MMERKVTKLFKNEEYEALFRFAYAPVELAKIEYFNFNEFKNETIKSICKDVINDFKHNNKNLHFNRHPRIVFEECFKSKDHMIVFFLLYFDCFSNSTHGCGEVYEDILGVTEKVEDITELAVEWKRKMFSAINNVLDDISPEQEVFAKTSVIELWRMMNISEAPEEDLEDLVYID